MEQGAQREIRDLLSLLALPSLWVGQSAQFISKTMIEAVERLVPFRVALARVPGLDGPEVQLFRLDGKWLEAPGEWLQMFAGDLHSFPASSTRPAQSPIGPMQLAAFNLGYRRDAGAIIFGATTQEFPTKAQNAILRSAASLAATSLATAASEQKLRMADRAKDEFLAMLGHELRNPLAPIVSALDLLRHQSPQGLGFEHRIIERQVGKLSRLVDDLLDVSRVVSGKIRVQVEQMDLVGVVSDVLLDFRTIMAEKRITLSASLPERLVVLGDKTRLDQVIRNLVVNASKFTNVGGHIEVDLRSKGGMACLRVVDDGCGIAEALLPHVFDLFTQGPTTVARSEGGLGVGLALVKRLVELQGGSVAAHSGGTGQGAELEVRIPLAADSKLPHAVIAATRQPEVMGVRVLLVDDNRDALDALANILSISGFEVATASDGDEALQVAASFSPSHVILDIGLPLRDGYQVAQALRARHAGGPLKLAALTGYGLNEDKQKSRDAGFDMHFTKPVGIDLMLSFLSPGAA